MKQKFTLEFLQDKIGAEYIELNPLTGNPRIIRGLNEVWEYVDDFGGLACVASHFDLPEESIWSWIDNHFVPELYALELARLKKWIPDMQLSSVGYTDPRTKRCWPRTWKLERRDFR
jgi:hypothetical protein